MLYSIFTSAYKRNIRVCKIITYFFVSCRVSFWLRQISICSIINLYFLVDFVCDTKRIYFILFIINTVWQCPTLCEKCPNTEFFLVRVFPYSVRIRENADQKKLLIWTLFTQCKTVRDLGGVKLIIKSLSWQRYCVIYLKISF